MAEGVEFVDECTVHVRGGHGGNGVVAFRRESHVPRGGPNGGDGGHGGDVVLIADRNTSSLIDHHRNPHRRADDGRPGEGMEKTGRNGQDRVVRVPVGTVVRDRDTTIILADLVRDGQSWVAARGGRGGRGNTAFANQNRRVPQFAERGEPAKEHSLRLELKLIADVGLVGYPSAGKSSLIGHLSAAKPKVAAYPFTTLAPHLGVVRAGDTDFVMADVPGLIEGASEGRGLGHQFLRHIERCACLLHVLDCYPMEQDRDPIRDLDALLIELEKHDESMLDRPQVVALNKIDLVDGKAMADLVRPTLEERGFTVLEISATSGEGLSQLAFRLAQIVQEARAAVPVELVDEVAPEELVITFRAPKRPFTIIPLPEHNAYRVAGELPERWVAMLPLEIPEAVNYLQGKLRRAGVDRALVRAGARQGDEVVIGEAVFDFVPELDDLPREEREAIIAAEFDDDAELDAWKYDDDDDDDDVEDVADVAGESGAETPGEAQES